MTAEEHLNKTFPWGKIDPNDLTKKVIIQFAEEYATQQTTPLLEQIEKLEKENEQLKTADWPSDEDIAFEIVATFLRNPHPKQRKNYDKEKIAFGDGAKWMREKCVSKISQLQEENTRRLKESEAKNQTIITLQKERRELQEEKEKLEKDAVLFKALVRSGANDNF